LVSNAGTVLSTGPLYEVREGDYLEALSKRFLVPVDNLLRSNPDVALGNSSLAIGTHSVSRREFCLYYPNNAVPTILQSFLKSWLFQ
jgi:hypothetical protein